MFTLLIGITIYMFINLFEIKLSPEIDKLYVSNFSGTNNGPSDEIFIKVNSDSIVTLTPQLSARPIVNDIDNYKLWLLREHLFRQIEKSTLFYDFNRRNGSFSILADKIYRDEKVSILREVVVRFYLVKERLFISLLPRTSLQNRISLDKLLSTNGFGEAFFIRNKRVLVYLQRENIRGWYPGYIKSISDIVKVEIPSLFDGTVNVEKQRVIPKLRKADYAFDEEYFQKLTKISQSASKASAKDTWLVIETIISTYIKDLFKVPVSGHDILLKLTPLEASHLDVNDISDSERKSQYVFNRNGKTFSHSSRLQGLSQFDLTTSAKTHNIVLFGTDRTIGILEDLVEKLNEGIQQGTYKFDMPSKFGVRLKIVDRYVTRNFNQYLDESNKFIFSVEEKHKDALVLAFLPENSDLYYQFKAKLAAAGKVSQFRSKMITDIYTAWNIAANIYAKIGYTPWGISESSNPNNADLVLGFAYSSLNVEGRMRRNIGYVNVYDRNGEWKFMRSHPGLLDFDNRLKILPKLIRDALYSYMALGTEPQIIDIHYSKKFSKHERRAVFDAVIQLIPGIRKVNFVSINDDHTLRVFDPNAKSFAASKGKIIFIRPDQFLLSITDKIDSFRQLLITVDTEGEDSSRNNNCAVAERIIALAKLNWRSVVRDSSEPVTVKYSKEIAKLTNHFTLTEWKVVSNNLANVPWFI